MADEFVLTAANYYGQRANERYYSVSQVKSFMKCPDAAMAELTGRYKREKTTSLLVGGYVDAWFSGEMDEFVKSNPDIFNARTGELKAEFRKAKDVIARLHRDELVRDIANRSETQKIVTGDIAGYPFKAKLDFWLDAKGCNDIALKYPALGDLMFAKGCIIDLKVMKDFEPIFVPQAGKQHFIEAWGYDLQLAVYQELMRQEIGEDVPVFILAATKEHDINIDLFGIDQDILDQRMDELVERMADINEVKQGLKSPARCGDCAWCRMTKKLTGAVRLEAE